MSNNSGHDLVVKHHPGLGSGGGSHNQNHHHHNNHDAALSTMTTTTTTTTTTTATDTLESKIQGAAAMYRRERDEAHRTHQLAREKLVLIEDETAAAIRTLQSMQHKVQQVQIELEKEQQHIHNVQRDVETLTQQVSFQHAEYLKMRDTYQGHVTKQRMDRTTRDNARAKLQAALGPCRARVTQFEQELEQRDPEEEDEHSKKNRRDCKLQARRLRDEAEADDAYDRQLWRHGTWPRLVREQVQVWERHSRRVEHGRAVVERTLHGYHRHLPQCYLEAAEAAETPAESKEAQTPGDADHPYVLPPLLDAAGPAVPPIPGDDDTAATTHSTTGP